MPTKSRERLFGTDGIRGTANMKLTPEFVTKVGQATGLTFMENNGQHRHQVVIAKDTRLSGYILEPALQAGIASVGMDVCLTGPLPTPGVAMLTKSMRCDLGVMISASHNPYEDNGIKLFGADGYKLADSVEDRIETLFYEDLSGRLATSEKLGRARRIDDAQGQYSMYVKGTLPRNVSFEKVKVVVDSGHGAAHKVAPRVLQELGAHVIAIGADPNGTNINEGCGSTVPWTAAAKVLVEQADVGVALDGDADRLVILDEKGQVINGDQIMALLATEWLREGRLTGGGIVATLMSNLGLERYLKGLGLTLERTQVGDRYVIERMRQGAFNLGGEQSGHIIFSDFSTTGDGLMAALQVIAIIRKQKRLASQVCRLFEPVPQLLENVRYCGKEKPLENAEVKRAIKAAEKTLGDKGRILVRNSGTEPVVRVMVEGDDREVIQAILTHVKEVISSKVG